MKSALKANTPKEAYGSEGCRSEHSDVGITVSLSPPTPVFTCFCSYVLIGEMSCLRLKPHQITHMLAASLRSSFLPGLYWFAPSNYFILTVPDTFSTLRHSKLSCVTPQPGLPQSSQLMYLGVSVLFTHSAI